VKEEIFTLQNIKIKICSDSLVFPPSPHGTKGLGENIEVRKGDWVLDIGTGTGILAILAAKMGGKVWAVDILDREVECAKQNALLNKVKISIVKSDLFREIPKRKYDVIIANVPQELLSPKIIKNSKPEIIIGMHGFGDGSRLLIKTLKQAKPFMKQSSRLFVVVYTMIGWRNSLKYISKNYSAKLLDFFPGEVKSFVYEDLEWYKSRPEIGTYRKGEKYWADLFVFELKLK